MFSTITPYNYYIIILVVKFLQEFFKFIDLHKINEGGEIQYLKYYSIYCIFIIYYVYGQYKFDMLGNYIHI